MKVLNGAVAKLSRCFTLRGWILALVTALTFAAPTMAMAAESDVKLHFTSSDQIWLIVSLVLGVAAVLFAFGLRASILRESPGSENMQRVGQAISEGALAYLRQQVQTMAIFVVLLAVGLYFMFDKNIGISIAFIAGVGASYIAGYTGMLTAVSGNMRTANAALTSYKKTLEIAFRSGAVAGMITVGMGLVGATAILFVGGEHSMQYLVGFGFGGSLAALFMRVGGGIFTKAADVGADLVGKVEAGIPEDDPRNPAVIADNVGDNVGDCAGMAADVFESYEVTLVAAIVLGAATSAIFDESTWMRLILFALIARGIGIVASALGILSVKGDDNVDADPLKKIRSGFYFSAAIAAIATFVLAWAMMGGQKDPIVVRNLTPFQKFQNDEVLAVQAARDHIAAETKKQPFEIHGPDLRASKDLAQYDYKQQDDGQLEAMANQDLKAAPLAPPPSLSGYTLVDFSNKKQKLLSFALPNPDFDASAAPGTPKSKQFSTIGEVYGPEGSQGKLVIAKIHQVIEVPPSPAQGNVPANPGQKQDNTVWFGPISSKTLDDNIAKAKEQIEQRNASLPPSQRAKANIEKLSEVPAHLYANPDGDLAFGIDTVAGGPERPNTIIAPGRQAYFEATPEELDALQKQMQSGARVSFPTQHGFQNAMVKAETVSWIMFALAIGFGLLMAFAIEALTDYYVSTHKRPTQEVAGVSNAGPAPMIIQGFAYAAESSVFMVFAIVVALLAPIFFFPQSLILSFYGVALVGLGLLTTTGYVLAMDTFGPISDNAQGVYEMSGDGHDNEYGSKAVQRLDAAGNTTKALTKGFAIATAVVAAVALFHSYLESSHLETIGLRLDLPEIFLGLLIGGAAPYLFSASTINAVGRAAFELIHEVRRQFRNDAGIMAGTSKPDYGRCVAIVTAAAQKELIGPAILAIFLPVAVAFGFSINKPQTIINGQAFNLTGAEALGGFLAGAILSGQLMAVLLANSGGMWDNAKKLIEDGLYGGKGTEAHKAAVVCDTVGDPFKDTAGPALNPLIKVMNLVALLFAPIYIRPFNNNVLITITLVAIAVLGFSIWWSKRGSMSTGMQAAATEESSHAAMTEGSVEAPKAAKKKLLVEEASDEEPKG